MKDFSRLFPAGFTLAILLLFGCATLTSDISVETHSVPDIDYSRYKTYAWLGNAQIVFDPIGQWEQPTLDTDEEVRFLVNRELREHGLSPVNKEPDLFVTFASGVDMTALELKEDPKTQKKVLANIPKAALLIALVDARTGYTVWLGYATGYVQKQQSIENIRQRIDYAVSRIFRDFDNSAASKERFAE